MVKMPVLLTMPFDVMDTIKFDKLEIFAYISQARPTATRLVSVIT
jgi:hypothetical protein